MGFAANERLVCRSAVQWSVVCAVIIAACGSDALCCARAGDDDSAGRECRLLWSRLAEDRRRINHGRVRLRAAISKSSVGGGDERNDQLRGASLDYWLIFSGERFRASLDERRPLNPSGETHSAFSVMDGVYRIIPTRMKVVCLEYDRPRIDLRRADSGTVSHIYVDPLSLGFWPGTLQSLGGGFGVQSLDTMMKSVENVVLLDDEGGATTKGYRWVMDGGAVLCDWRFRVDQENMPVDVTLRVKGASESKLSTVWKQYPFVGDSESGKVWFPSSMRFGRSRDGVVLAEEEWIVSEADFMSPVDESEFKWSSLGIWEGAVVKQISTDGNERYTQWSDGTFGDWKPTPLTAPSVSNKRLQQPRQGGGRWLVIAVNVVGAVALFVYWWWRRHARGGV